MTLITPEEHVSDTAELLRSLHVSIRRLRQQTEALRQDLASGEEADIGRAGREISAVEGLIRTCQKVEASLVEQYQKRSGIVRGGYALDLENARAEIGVRLARLRACGAADEVPE